MILKRIEEKEFAYTPIFNVKIKEHAEFVLSELNKDIEERFWISKHFKLLEFYMDQLNDIKENMENLEKILN